MKKVLSRILAMALAVILFAAPTATVSAATTPTLVMNTDGIKIFQYLPDPYSLPANQSLILSDTTTSDGYWKVPAGNKFTFSVSLDDDAVNQYQRVLVSSKKQGIITYTDIDSYKHPQFNLPALPYDDEYQFWLVAITDLSVSGYVGYVRAD
ncbi:hypothetical protein [Anaerocolumna jejuensis]|uniref:hypothetical protein n=1 Tax=Anaerocolumna jejuensis TaxID=259063 RepID=UPI003F7C0A74